MSENDPIFDDIPQQVREALECLRDVPTPSPEVWEHGRRTFLTQAHQLSPQAVTPGYSVRHKGWKATLSAWLLQIPLKRKEISMASLINIIIGLTMVFALSTGTVSAAQESLPGSSLYPLKLTWEEFQLSLMSDPEIRVEQALSTAQNRLLEALQLAQQSEDIPIQLVERYQSGLNLAFTTTDGLNEPAKTQVHLQFQEQLSIQQQILAQIMTHIQNYPDATSQERVRLMVQVREQVEEQLCTQNKSQSADQFPGGESNMIQNQYQNQPQDQTQNQNHSQNQEQNQEQDQNQTQNQNHSQNQEQNQEQDQNQNQSLIQPQNQIQYMIYNMIHNKEQNETNNQKQDETHNKK